MIQLQKVTFAYPSQIQQPVLRRLSLNLRMDICTGLTGSNGAGKTTLGLLMMGLLQPVDGQVLINGKSISDIPLHQIGRQIGYLFQNPRQQLFADTVLDELLFPFILQQTDSAEIRKRADKLLTLFQLARRKNENPLRLSTGEQKRLALAALMMNEPDFLILDEPTNSLDLASRRVLGDLMTERIRMQKGLLLISHDQPFVSQYCQSVLFLDDKKIQEVACAT